MTSPEEGEVPNFWAAAEKYSTLSGSARGEGGRFDGCSKISFVDLVERSESEREPTGRDLVVEVVEEGLAGGLLLTLLWRLLKNDVRVLTPGLVGDVAIGMNEESTVGFVTAV